MCLHMKQVALIVKSRSPVSCLIGQGHVGSSIIIVIRGTNPFAGSTAAVQWHTVHSHDEQEQERVHGMVHTGFGIRLQRVQHRGSPARCTLSWDGCITIMSAWQAG